MRIMLTVMLTAGNQLQCFDTFVTNTTMGGLNHSVPSVCFINRGSKDMKMINK